MKQTAVEWLMEQWPILESQIPPRIIEQAKAMEKDQLIEAFSYGVINHHDAFKNQNEFSSGKQYYNETYKSE